ncbi:MAG TPA: transcription antitermination factor NusB [Clostridiales bacterium]|nr:transcription antitermination factor NusB [Clostridiales bacterium]
MSEISRIKEREQAVIYIFEKQFQTDENVADLALLSVMCETTVTSEYSVKLAETAEKNIAEIDELISKNLKTGWTIFRIPKIVLAILRIAITEIKYIDEIPVSVAINEAVELAKKYATDKEKGFINGLLASIAKESSNE